MLTVTLHGFGVNYTCRPGAFSSGRSLTAGSKLSSKQRTLIIPPALVPVLQTFLCVYAYMQAKAKAGNGTEAEPGDSDTAANQRFITQPSSLLPSGDSHHLCSHSQGAEPFLYLCVSLSDSHYHPVLLFSLMPHQLINHWWEQRGAGIDNTDVPREGNSESRYPVTCNSSFIQTPPTGTLCAIV